MSKKVVSIMLCMILFISIFAFSSFAVDESTLPDGVYVAGYLNFDEFVNEPVYSADDSLQISAMSLKTVYTFPSGYNTPSLAYNSPIESLSPLATFGRFKLYAYYCSGTCVVWHDSILNISVCSYNIPQTAANHDLSNESVSVPFFWLTCGFRDSPTYKDVRVGFFFGNKTSRSFTYGSEISQYLPYFTFAPVPEKPKYSTAKFDLVNTTPAVNLVVTNSGNIPSNVSVTDLFVGIKLNHPTTLEQYLWKKDLDCRGSCLVSVGSSGVSTTSTLFSYDFLPHGISSFKFKSGRSYTLTLYDFTGDDYFAADPDKINILDTLTFTVDGTVKPPPDIPVGDTTYSPTPPQTPSTGDVNVITNTSGNITGIQQWDGNQWIIIDKIEIVNNPDSGGGSGGSGGGTTPDKPTDDKGIWDWLFGKIGDLISTIFKGILDILTKCVGTLVDGVIAIVENLFKLLNSVVNFGGDFPKMIQGFFSFLPPEIITLICLMFTLSIAIIIIKFFIR